MRSLIVFILFIAFFPALYFADNGYTITIENDKSIILMNIKCSPCDLVCDKIEYQILDKSNATSVTGRGKSINTGTNSNFRGYVLDNGSSVYSLTESAESQIWNLSVQKNLKIISEQQLKTIFDNGNC